MPREIAREHLTWSGQRPGRQKSARRGGRLGRAAPAERAAQRPRGQGQRPRNAEQSSAHRSAPAKRNALPLSRPPRQNKKCTGEGRGALSPFHCAAGFSGGGSAPSRRFD
ncbi:unnamed protein product, partial [Bubo scandiacus]